MFTARHIALLAATVTCACVFVIVPLALGGDDVAAPAAADANEAAALTARADIAQDTQAAVDHAPRAVGDHCGRTYDDEVLGDVCRTRDGQLLVEVGSGEAAPIHGADAPALSDNYAPDSQAAADAATVGDIDCVDASKPHYTLVYARPASVASRYVEVAPQLRQEIYRTSAFYDAESRSVAPTVGLHLPIRCTGGNPDVLDAAVPDGNVTFSAIVDSLAAQGYEYNGNGTNMERYIVYFDAPVTANPFVAGTGHVYGEYSNPGADNPNALGGLYAVHYNYSQSGGVPHWQTLAHEVSHTMGAVLNAAPHSTRMNHCTDGADVMCYEDGSGAAYSSSSCASKVLDCNRDDYFNPAPAAGSYLATHWNMASTDNRFLNHRAVDPALTPLGSTASGSTQRTPQGVDRTRPSAPAARFKPGKGFAVLTWRASRDNSGSVTYSVSQKVGKKWSTRATGLRGTSLRMNGLRRRTAYVFRIEARDRAGNTSLSRPITVRLR